LGVERFETMSSRVFALVVASFVFHAVVLFSAEGPHTNYDEARVRPYTLPDPLVLRDGTRVTDPATWKSKRRPELLEVFASQVYGRTKVGRPPGMSFEVTSVDRAALGGKAVRKEVTIWFGPKQPATPKLDVLIYQPKGEAGAHAPWPAFVGLNYYGNACVNADPAIKLSTSWMRANEPFGIVNNRATEKTRGSHASRWEVEKIVARGYATVTAYYGDICPDRNGAEPEALNGLLQGRVNAQRQPDEWAAIGMWAWGLSRIMDYLETDPELDARRVALHGHSRLGKAALWAGAQDERFAIVISNDSGCGGAALERRNYGETVADITSSFPHWFARNFANYAGREEQLPVDTHQLLALMAPRPAYVASAIEDRWADPKGEFLALKATEPVYALFGLKGLGTATHPPVDTPVGEGVLGYHMRRGIHDINAYDWEQYVGFADRMWRKN
jgi:hypothetical protein